MYIDYEFFSYGVGLVMIGWIVGMCGSIIFGLIKKIGII